MDVGPLANWTCRIIAVATVASFTLEGNVKCDDFLAKLPATEIVQQLPGEKPVIKQ